MQSQPKLKIAFPTCVNGVKKRFVPHKFVIAGQVSKKYPGPVTGGASVDVDVTNVTAEVVSLSDMATTLPPRDCAPFRTKRTSKNEYFWHVKVNVPMLGLDKAPVLVLVKVYGGGHLLDQASVRIWIDRHGHFASPTVDYPGIPPYAIEGDERECIYFIGTADDTPVVQIVDNATGTEIYNPIDGDFIPDNPQTTHGTWWAMFYPLFQPGVAEAGVYELLVSQGANSTPFQISVEE